MTGSPELDGMIERQSTLGRDPATRNKLIQDIQRRIIDDGGWIHVENHNSIFLAQSYVRNFNPNNTTHDPNGTYVLDLWLDK
jgi:hypothetical protein